MLIICNVIARLIAPERLDQVAALPLGARLALDPWSARRTLLRTPEVPLVSAHEKVPFAVTAQSGHCDPVDALH